MRDLVVQQCAPVGGQEVLPAATEALRSSVLGSWGQPWVDLFASPCGSAQPQLPRTQ